MCAPENPAPIGLDEGECGPHVHSARPAFEFWPTATNGTINSELYSRTSSAPVACEDILKDYSLITFRARSTMREMFAAVEYTADSDSKRTRTGPGRPPYLLRHQSLKLK